MSRGQKDTLAKERELEDEVERLTESNREIAEDKALLLL